MIPTAPNERIKLDGAFSKVLTGGGISHLNLGERLTHENQMKKLIEYAIKYGCEHFAINYEKAGNIFEEQLERVGRLDSVETRSLLKQIPQLRRIRRNR